MSKIALKAIQIKDGLPKHIPYQICPHCDYVFYHKEEFGPEGCGCQHDPKDGPQPGDSIVLVGEHKYYGLYKGNRAVVEGRPSWAPSLIHICLGAYTPFRDTHLSISGGPWILVKPSSLKYIGIKPVTFWKWDRWGSRADGREYYTLTLPVWELDIERLA